MNLKIPNLNLVNQVKVDASSIKRSPGFYKLIVLDALGVLAAFGIGFAYAGYLAGTASLTLLLVMLGLFSMLSTFQVFFGEDLGRRLSLIVLETVALLVYFYQHDLRILVASASIMVIFQIWGFTVARNELTNSLKIRFFRASRLFLGKLTTALTLTLIVLYIPTLDENTMFVSSPTFTTLFDSTTGIVGNFYPGLNLSSSFGNFAESLAKTQFANTPSFKRLSFGDREAALRQSANQIAPALEERLGIKISPTESTSNVFYRFILKTLNDWRIKFQDWFGIGWLLIVFFIVRGFGSIFTFVVSLVSFVVYQILLGSEFAHIIAESVTQERIEF